MSYIDDELAFLRRHPQVAYASLVGSTAVLGEGADVDLLVMLEQGVKHKGWKAREESIPCLDNTYEGSGDFSASRAGVFNYIVVDDQELYSGWLAAGEVCKYLQLKDKAQRIAVHRIVRDGLDADEV